MKFTKNAEGMAQLLLGVINQRMKTDIDRRAGIGSITMKGERRDRERDDSRGLN